MRGQTVTVSAIGFQRYELAAKSILGSHAFTECDTTSAFCDKEKVKPFIKFADLSVNGNLQDGALNIFNSLFVTLMAIKGAAPIP